MTTLNRSSSFRLELWSNAIRHPPENLLLGAGLGNTPNSLLAVNTATSANLRHLHNFVLDTWHETGLLGLTMLMAWLVYLIRATFEAWQHAPVRVRTALGGLLGASAAILTSALLSFSYGSKQFACYLFVLLVAGVASREMMRRGTGDPDGMPPGTSQATAVRKLSPSADQAW
jgi:O-antigen ligase